MKRPTIYLHIGFHKTGTTSIQNLLAANADRFAAEGCLVPTTGRAGSGHALLANSLKKAVLHLDADALYAALGEEIRRSEKGMVVISSECFMEGIPPRWIREHFERLNADVKIIVYLRRQDDWLQSVYNEVVRDPSRRYTGDIMHMREVRQNVPDFGSVLQKWERAFGPRNIIVRVFEREQMPEGLLADFVTTLGLRWRDDFYVHDTRVSGNVGFPDALIVALRTLNQVPMKREMYRRLVAALSSLALELHDDKRAGGYSLVSPADRRAFLAHYAEGNERIARELLGRSDGRLFYAPLPEDTDGWRGTDRPEPDLQLLIFQRLPEDIRDHLQRVAPRFKKMGPGVDFFPLPTESEEDRLRLVVRRLRTELNWLYDERDAQQTKAGKFPSLR